MNKIFNRYIIVLSALLLAGCAGGISSDDTALESYNHAMFKFNNAVEKGVIRPVAKGYKYVTNDYTRQRVANFFNNLIEPVSMVNHLLQGEPHQASENIARFVINSTIGGLGLYDMASVAGLPKNETGFDETMSTWCVPDGPYVVLPIFGPSTPRAATGFVVDSYSSPVYWAVNEGDDETMAVYYGAGVLKYLNKYAQNMNLIEDLEKNSVDYYAAVKSMYLQSRNKMKHCHKYAEETAQPDYDFDMDDED